MKVEITKYICDWCKREIEPEEYTRVGIRMEFRNPNNIHRDIFYEGQDVCDECMKGIGIDPIIKPEIKSFVRVFIIDKMKKVFVKFVKSKEEIQ